MSPWGVRGDTEYGRGTATSRAPCSRAIRAGACGRWTRAVLGIAVALAAALASGCSGSDAQSGEDDSPDSGTGGTAPLDAGTDTTLHVDSGGHAGALPDASEPDSLAAYCEGSGPPIQLPIFGDCTADIAKKVFTFAVCSCSGMTYSGTLRTDSFDSSSGSQTAAGASVGVNGDYNACSLDTQIGGSLWVDGKVVANGHEIAGDLQCGGTFFGNSTHVGNDAYIESMATGVGNTIDGTLHIPPGTMHQGITAQGGVVEEPVSVKTPCNCDDPVDIAAIVGFFEEHNDNDLVGLEPDALAMATGDRNLSLPCGRYFLDEISGSARIKVELQGRTTIAVGRSVHVAGSLEIELAPGAELDLFVADEVGFAGPVHLGDPAKPAATRVYIGANYVFAGNQSLVGNFYVPNGSFAAATHTELWGALFAKSIGLAGELVVHYDEAILDLEGCPPPDLGCGDCHSCANPNPACKDGVCAPCESNSDCCPPLHCNEGVCVAGIVK